MMEEKIRAVIEQRLRELKQELEQFDQTTHGMIGSNDSISNVCIRLNELYTHPSAYSNSSLIQVIECFLKNK